VASVEEKIGLEGEFMFIDSCSYVDTIYPHGYAHFVKAWLRPYPAFLFSSNPYSEHILVLKELFMDETRNVTLLRYTNRGTVPFRYFFRYKFSLRDHHELNRPGTFDSVGVEHEAFDDGLLPAGWVRRSDNGLRAYVYAAHGGIASDLRIYRNVFYPQEANRGYDAFEDLVAPFLHEGYLRPGACTEVILSDRSLADYYVDSRPGLDSLFDGAYSRYAGHPLPADHPSRAGTAREGAPPEKGDFARLLRLMLDDFRAGDDVVAGFPWFSASGRETMIALKAYMGRDDDSASDDFAARTLIRYGERMAGGLVPEATEEREEGKGSDAVDTSLWFVLRVYECFESLAPQRRKKLFACCERVVLSYLFDRELPFFWDAGDSLVTLRSGTNLALTWMNAKTHGYPVTPRYGKPIEVNGLWYNAVRATARMADALGRETIRCPGSSPSGDYALAAGDLEQLAGHIARSLKGFLSGDLWCDRIENGVPVPEIRPNFVVALSLPFDFADAEGLRKGVSQAREHLLTPYGLRTLSPGSPMYRQWYIGNQKMRDMAYHQGTVWTWLLLPYAELLRKVTGDRRVLKEELASLTSGLRRRLARGTLASVAEVWDGEDPGVPKGAPAQASSVAALYCIERMIESS
jgi:glycogen debranching enzyme